MRKIITIAILLVVLGSCTLSKQNKLYRSTVDGTWTLQEVSYEGADGTFSSILFKDADAKCFEGSTWFFRANNSTGYYRIQKNGNCIAGDRYIRWTIQEENNTNLLQFKFTDQKRKDLADYGFRLTIDYLDASRMKLHSTVNVEGQIVHVVYNFNRVVQ